MLCNAMLLCNVVTNDRRETEREAEEVSLKANGRFMRAHHLQALLVVEG